jgi:hypothetical protein
MKNFVMNNDNGAAVASVNDAAQSTMCLTSAVTFYKETNRTAASIIEVNDGDAGDFGDVADAGVQSTGLVLVTPSNNYIDHQHPTDTCHSDQVGTNNSEYFHLCKGKWSDDRTISFDM